MIRTYPYNSPITTDTVNRNPYWEVSEVNSDPNFAVGYKTEDILDYGLDRLNRDV